MLLLQCDLATPLDHFPHPWEHTIGSGYAPLALRADWQSQLKRCHDELGIEHVRFHGILSDRMGTMVVHREEPLYSFFNADQIMDFLLNSGMRPFVELSFMPAGLSSGHKTVFSYEGNVTPPENIKDWTILIEKLVGHWVDRYGVEEVRHWFFEVWNEPNLHHFWTGNQADYFDLYRHTFATIKEIDSSLRVGGPATAQNAWIPEFIEFGEGHDAPPDFVTTHYYPTDAFGEIGADSDTQLERAPREVMRQRAEEARSQAGDRPLYYTEWNTSSNPRHDLHDQPASASFATRIVMSVRDLVDGYSIWTFSDIFEENYFPSVPFHGGFGLLNLYGVAKPVYRAYQLMHRLGTEGREIETGHETVDAWLTRNGSAITMLLTNDAQPRHLIQAEPVKLRLTNAPRPAHAYLERIDADHANPERLWQEMGSPDYLSPSQVEELRQDSELRREPIEFEAKDGVWECQTQLAEHSVTALTIEFAAALDQ
ncbi:MAG: GH39 family glycosyl hydrolase [Acidimicrobiia bacterium]